MRKLLHNTNIDNLKTIMTVLNLSANYAVPIKAFLSYCAQHNLKPDVFAFRKAVDDRYSKVKLGMLSASTYNLFVSANRNFILRSMELRNHSSQDFLAAQRMTKVKSIKINPRIDADGVLTQEEIAILMEYATPRTKLLIQALKRTGLRISEVLRLPSSMERRKNYVQATILAKGSKMRQVYLPFDLFQDIRREFNGQKFLFETKSGGLVNRSDAFKMIKSAARKAVSTGKVSVSLLRKAHPHGFRHSFACHSLARCKDIYLVSQMLSHASVSTTAKFYVAREVRPEDYLNVYS